MNILVDGQTLHTFERERGIGRYFINTLDAILSLDTGHSFTILAHGNFKTEGLPDSFRKAKFLKLDMEDMEGRLSPEEMDAEARYEVSLNRVLEKERIDLYWNPNPLMHNVMLPSKNGRCAFVATIFDLIPLKFRKEYIDRWPVHLKEDYIRRLTCKLYGYDRLLVISWATKADVMDALNVSGDRVEVTHLGVDDNFFRDPGAEAAKSVRDRYSIKGDYILYTGGFDFRKNMERLLEGFSRFTEKYGGGLDLVIVCAFDGESRKRFNAIIKKERLEGRVILTNHVSDPDLIVLYRGSALFVFPSLYEGFGLPVIEAMACGVPVAASSYSSVPEILREGGTYFDPYSAERIAEGMKKALEERENSGLKENNIKRARGFSWQATAKRTLEIFKDLYEK